MMYKRVIVSVVLFFLLASLWGQVLLSQEVNSKKFVRYLTTWGGRGDGSGQFKEPQGLAVDPSGFLYVADTGNQRVQKLDSNGAFMTEIGGFGWESEHFDRPVAVSARNGLDVFIADYNNQRIERYDKDLYYLASFLSSRERLEHLRFGFPRDVDLSSQGELFCLDGENHRVLKLDVLGSPQLSFGDFDAGQGRLVNPQRLMVSRRGGVYVSDEEESRIVVYDMHGNYLFTMGEGILKRPLGMDELLSDFILVADGAAAQVFIFQNMGGRIGSFGGGEASGVSFKEPVDVACWRDRIYVLDKKRSVLDVFQWTYDEEKNSH